MKIPLYQVDAFTDRIFAGNPAAVCPLDSWLPDETLSAIARENNLSETAFFVPDGDGYELRWLTPEVEVELCGHATLASAYVLFERLGAAQDALTFRTRSGPLVVTRTKDGYAMDFPALSPEPVKPESAISSALGRAPSGVVATPDHYVAVFEDAEEVAALAPDFPAVKRLARPGVIATAPGSKGADFVSRYFAPQKGIDEDPVTGSAHCVLAPYWAARLGKRRLFARQISRRGGELALELRGDRLIIEGKAALYLEGTIFIDAPAARP